MSDPLTTPTTTPDNGKLTSESLRIAYGSHVVVHSADVTLLPGHVTALVGPNGSGKSTLLRTLSRLHTAQAGSITLDADTDAAALNSREFARRVTLLSQSRPTPAGLTVRDVVEFGRHPHRRGWRGNDPHGPLAIARALTLTGIDSLADQPVDTLSGGQLQRVWFASALAQDTTVLLLDEPTNHLDLRYQMDVLHLMRSLADDHNITVGVVLHDLNHAAAVADTVIVMDNGQVVANAAPEESLTSPLLTSVYDIDVHVERHPTGALSITTPASLTLRQAHHQATATAR
ncbi:ABC transporter ATP-binding protein [Jonesia quinghaiensis]|uniref:ABC transporter ATP-binding protein n=1 Tax=Jonesia quinghaiensis TaxID=262806 RepID=UPI0004177AD4|nr:ABC transporter ATP-binding protein [Jonesia quinghaiensis]